MGLEESLKCGVASINAHGCTRVGDLVASGGRQGGRS